MGQAVIVGITPIRPQTHQRNCAQMTFCTFCLGLHDYGFIQWRPGAINVNEDPHFSHGVMAPAAEFGTLCNLERYINHWYACMPVCLSVCMPVCLPVSRPVSKKNIRRTCAI